MIVQPAVLSATRQTVSWPRKVFHASTISAVAFVAAFSGLEKRAVLALLGSFAVVVGGLDALRLAWPSFNARVLRDFSRILRHHEEHTVSSGFWFLLAAVLTLVIAPLPVAAVALLYLALGDPVASWVGVRFGRTKLPGGKSLEGSLAFVLTCAVVGAVFLGATSTVTWAAAPLVALAGALAAGFAEWLPIERVDDNLRVPLAAAVVLTSLAPLFAPAIQV
jgi:dolichol kinase